MTWNHRVVKRILPDGTVTFGVYEVYYDEKAVPSACTESPVEPYGETLEELKTELERFQLAASHPVLNYEDFSSTSTNLFTQSENNTEEV